MNINYTSTLSLSIAVIYIPRNRPYKLYVQSSITSTVHNVVQDMIDEDARQRRVRTRMRLPVTDQTRLLSEGLATNITHVRSDAGVDE